MGFFDFLFNANTDTRSDNANTDIKSENKKEIESEIEPIDYNTNTTRFQPFNEEFSLDMTTESYGSDMTQANNSYSVQGVELLDARNTLRLVYSGVLAESGPEQIYAVVGYGNNLNWENVQEFPMYSTSPNKYELMLPVTRTGNINIVFKDSSNNWDNNSGLNYSFTNYIYEGSH